MKIEKVKRHLRKQNQNTAANQACKDNCNHHRVEPKIKLIMSKFLLVRINLFFSNCYCIISVWV